MTNIPVYHCIFCCFTWNWHDFLARLYNFAQNSSYKSYIWEIRVGVTEKHMVFKVENAVWKHIKPPSLYLRIKLNKELIVWISHCERYKLSTGSKLGLQVRTGMDVAIVIWNVTHLQKLRYSSKNARSIALSVINLLNKIHSVIFC